MNTIDVNGINPYIRVAMRSVLNRGKIIPQRIIFDYELIYIESGTMVFTYGGVPYRCVPGDFLLIRPGIPHRFDCTLQTLSQPHIHFDPIYGPNSARTPVSFKDFPQLTEEEQGLIQKDLFDDTPKTPRVVFSDREEALMRFYGVIDSLSADRYLLAKGLLTALLADLIRENFPDRLATNPETYGIARQVKDYMDSIRGICITLDSLARQFAYSKFHLEREFRKEYGVSLIAYANERRMEYAEELLEAKTVSETAAITGFSSIYSFSRAFKNRFGTPPSGKGRGESGR